MLKKEFVPYQESLELKELGFDEPCLKFHVDGMMALVPDTENGDTNSKLNGYNPLYVSAPTFSQAFRWFREEYNLIGGVEYIAGTKSETTWWDVYVIGYFNTNTSKMTMKYQPYEEAELACLRKLIEIAKENG